MANIWGRRMSDYDDTLNRHEQLEREREAFRRGSEYGRRMAVIEFVARLRADPYCACGEFYADKFERGLRGDDE